MEHPKFSILSNVENNDDTSGVKKSHTKKIKPSSKGPILANPVPNTVFWSPFFFFLNYIFKKGAWIKEKKIVKGKIGN
jgi:hypothetical protein